MNKKYMIGAILVLLISTFALGCIGSKQTVTPTPTETPQVTDTVAPIGTTEQVTPVGTTEQVTPAGTAMPNATVISPTMPISTVTPMPTTAPTSVAIEIKNSAFNPLTATISQGETVTWTNNDTVAHTVTSVNTGVFDSGSISPGTTYSYTFNQAGTFEYSCTIHPSIPHGTITVTSTVMTSTPTVTATSTATANTTP